MANPHIIKKSGKGTKSRKAGPRTAGLLSPSDFTDFTFGKGKMAKVTNIKQAIIIEQGAQLKIKDRSQSNPVAFQDLILRPGTDPHISRTEYTKTVNQLEKKGLIYIVGKDRMGLPTFLLPEDKIETLYWQAYNYRVGKK